MAFRNTNTEYVNVRRVPSTPISNSDKNLLRVVLLSFGLLCIIQATLNVTLRIFLDESDTNALELNEICKNFTDQKRSDFDQYFRDGWVYFNTSLYYISPAKRNWQDSRGFCLQRGADLIVINSREEQEFIRRFHRFMWIGLRNTTARTWIWVDGTPLTRRYWGPGEPNMGNDEGCVESRFFEVQDTWNDLNCNDQNFWVCERAMAR
ncbi:C-type lectin domain family 4 member M-like [Eucyclogobius newberryi]|uniref:C-type lectin domain family 4 member M-like n=1 Tax=Eucyclogobius newberryi TaxID=166745 RepID=UPI003B591B1A